jgi:predicted RNA binding protein YcfA (HicA-like mRNA interferase family)
LFRDNPQTAMTIPDHREIKRGTLRAIIRKAGLSVDEFVALL